jgi:hypothetical protein
MARCFGIGPTVPVHVVTESTVRKEGTQLRKVAHAQLPTFSAFARPGPGPRPRPRRCSSLAVYHVRPYPRLGFRV